MKKHTVTKVNGIRIAVKSTRWATPMLPRVPGTQVHQDNRHPSRAKSKAALRKDISNDF